VVQYAWLIPALPAASAVIILFLGRKLPKQGAEVGITAISIALGLSVLVAIQVFGANVSAVAEAEEALHAAVPADGLEVAATDLGVLAAVEEPLAIPAGVESYLYEAQLVLGPIGEGVNIEAGVRIDGLAVLMFLLVTFVSLMVQVYSTGYMHGDPRYTYFFFLLSLFTASMLLLVIANNLLQMLIGWELVGVCSFLLIGFWWEERKNSTAANKAFLTTKFGDVGLMVGVIAMYAQFRTFNIGEIIAAVGDGVQAGGEPLQMGMLTFALLSLFLGAVGKSAQFPLHTWLPDAMAGPTPVSALIHAATMVTAGVFLIARLYPVFHASATAVTVIAVIGGITLISAGLLAVVQDDLKKVLAYSTVSQLGYMVAALAFSYTAGIFHLFTHGFFKALLFLGAGSLIHAVHSNNMSDMGGLRKAMPATFLTFTIGSLALMALPPLAGFWSKDEVLVGAFEAGGYTGNLILILGVIGGFVTAFYMTRTLYLVFAGEYRGHGHPHESGPAMKWVLVALAVPAAVIGFINLPFDPVHPVGFAAWTMFSVEYFVGHPIEFVVWIAALSVGAALVAILAGRALYASPRERDPVLQLGLVTQVLQNRYYLDHLYEGVIVAGIKGPIANAAYWFNDNVLDRVVYLAGAGAKRAGDFTYSVFDQKGIDGAVHGVGFAARGLGAVFRKAQSGNVQLYAGAMFVGVFVLAIVFASA
jgi:NADH-quinone oxidoreductase subunit L